MKKLYSSAIASIVVLSSIGLSAVPVSGQAVSNDLRTQLDLIAKLTEQIRALKAQIENLNQQRQESTVQLVSILREGSTGDEVRVLQALLAVDSSIYPEGLVTGYFGRLTAQAVRKFQAKHKLEQVGQVGPKTRERLKELLSDNPISLEYDHEDSHGDENKRVCAIVPPGHLIAPGWLKKNDGMRPIVPECQTLPPGIAKRIVSTQATTTPDITAPVLSAIAISNVASTTATVDWTTDEMATSKVYYGLTTPLDLGTALTVVDATFVSSHSLNLSGLVASSTYYYVVESKDSSNNTSTSSELMFVTLP
jgi:hypothetical protein